MPIKKLAQLILAVEGFLLLTAIVVSTSYQLSRRSTSTETRSRAQTGDQEIPWGYLTHLGNEGTKVKFRVEAYDDVNLRRFMVLAAKVGNRMLPAIVDSYQSGTSFTGDFEWDTAVVSDSGQYDIWLEVYDAAYSATCGGQANTVSSHRCNRKDSSKTGSFSVSLPLSAVSKPKCNAFGLTLPAGKTSVLKTDPISIAINAKAAETGSALFASSRPIVLSALKQPAGTAHDFLDYGGEPSHCEGKATCVKADRGFTFEHAGITEAGEYKIYPFMTNSEGGTCTDKPGTPAANQCGCQPVAVTLVAQPAAAPKCEGGGLAVNKTQAGPTDAVGVGITGAKSGTSNFKATAAITLVGLRVSDNSTHGILAFDHCNGVDARTTACAESGRGFTPTSAGIPQAGLYKLYVFMVNQAGQRCDDLPGTPAASQCGCGVKELTVQSGSTSPRCVGNLLTLDKTQATPTEAVRATISATSGSTPFVANKVQLYAATQAELDRGVVHGLGPFPCGTGTSCENQPLGFTPTSALIATLGDYKVFVVIKNAADQILCTDNPKDTTNPDCSCGVKDLKVTTTPTPVDQVGCGSFKVLKNDAELTDPVKIRSGDALILRAASTFPTGVTMQGAIFASISKSLDIGTLRVIGVFRGSSGTPQVSWTVGDLALGEYYLFAVPGGLKGSAPMACSPFRLPYDLGGLPSLSSIDLRTIAECPNCKKLVEVVSAPPPAREVTLKLRDEGNKIFPASGFVCGTSAANNTQPLEFNLVATHAVDPADKLKNGVDRVELRYRMQGTSTWRGVAFHQCTKVWDNTKKTLVGPAECRLYNMDWWRWLPREFYQGNNLYEFKASAYSPNIGLYDEAVVSGVRCTGPAAQPRPPATVGDPKCDSFELSATQVTVNTPVRVDVKARCAGGTCTDLAKEGIRDFNFFQKKGEGNWLWAGSKSCYLSWPLHKVCFTGAYLKKDHCKTSDEDCDASAFTWVPTAVGTYQLRARVSNNAGRQVICGPKTITVTAAGGATLPPSWWQKLVATVQSWLKSLVPPALAQEGTAPLKVIFKLDDAPHSLLGRAMTVTLLNLEEGYNLVAVPRGEGIYEATINLPASAAGPARIGVKPAGYLQRVKEATLVAGQTITVDFGETEFLGGDLNNDNKLTIADLAEELLPQFSETNELSVQLNDDNRFMDLNDDGIINVLDISIVLKNLTELEVRGEE